MGSKLKFGSKQERIVSKILWETLKGQSMESALEIIKQCRDYIPIHEELYKKPKLNQFERFEKWFNSEVMFSNGAFMYNQEEITFRKIMRMKIDFRDITKTVFDGDSNSQKGFSALLKLSIIAPKQSSEACNRLLSNRYINYKLFILSLFALFRDFPVYRKKILRKFMFYDDSDFHWDEVEKIFNQNKIGGSKW